MFLEAEPSKRYDPTSPMHPEALETVLSVCVCLVRDKVKNTSYRAMTEKIQDECEATLKQEFFF